jgi:hypothetical protein
MDTLTRRSRGPSKESLRTSLAPLTSDGLASIGLVSEDDAAPLKQAYDLRDETEPPHFSEFER